MKQRFVKIKNQMIDFCKVIGWYIGEDYINLFIYTPCVEDAVYTIDNLTEKEFETVVKYLQTKFVKDSIV